MGFTPEGGIVVGISGYISGKAEVLKLSGNQAEAIADDLEPPLSGIGYLDGSIYVSHFNKITEIRPNGTRRVIISGLPTNGDHFISNVVRGSDNKIYFGVGTVTNSGVVGIDNPWLKNHPFLCDYAGGYIILNGQNYRTKDVFSLAGDAYTGAYSPYGIPNMPFEVRKGITKASGSILRANPDGTDLELYAWGFRYPGYIKFNRNFNLYASNQGCDARGSRPIANAPDEFHLVLPDTWYGWPDYVGGEPVTLPKYKPEGGVQPEFLLNSHPNLPPKPFAIFPNQSYIFGFDFNYIENFGNIGDVYIAEFGSGGRIAGETTPYSGMGHRISHINMNTGLVTTFAINKSGFPSSITGEGGFGRPIQVVFGPDNAMYVLDMGTNAPYNPSIYYPNTGVIWRITRE
jgi:glucose/arabinose dehydrogenase